VVVVVNGGANGDDEGRGDKLERTGFDMIYTTRKKKECPFRYLHVISAG
jgi:hypothetical protein